MISSPSPRAWWIAFARPTQEGPLGAGLKCAFIRRLVPFVTRNRRSSLSRYLGPMGVTGFRIRSTAFRIRAFGAASRAPACFRASGGASRRSSRTNTDRHGRAVAVAALCATGRPAADARRDNKPRTQIALAHERLAFAVSCPVARASRGPVAGFLAGCNRLSCEAAKTPQVRLLGHRTRGARRWGLGMRARDPRLRGTWGLESEFWELGVVALGVRIVFRGGPMVCMI